MDFLDSEFLAGVEVLRSEGNGHGLTTGVVLLVTFHLAARKRSLPLTGRATQAPVNLTPMKP